MKSMPASSAMRASARQSGQLADQRSGTVVAVRDDEQLAPNMPILSALALYMAMRSRIDAVPVGNFSLIDLGAQQARCPIFCTSGASSQLRLQGRYTPATIAVCCGPALNPAPQERPKGGRS